MEAKLLVTVQYSKSLFSRLKHPSPAFAMASQDTIVDKLLIKIYNKKHNKVSLAATFTLDIDRNDRLGNEFYSEVTAATYYLRKLC